MEDTPKPTPAKAVIAAILGVLIATAAYAGATSMYDAGRMSVAHDCAAMERFRVDGNKVFNCRTYP